MEGLNKEMSKIIYIKNEKERRKNSLTAGGVSAIQRFYPHYAGVVS